MMADMEAYKKLSPIITELFLREIKLNISLVLISQSYFKMPKTLRLNTTNSFFIKMPKKRELQQIASNHLSDTELKDFVNISKDNTKEPFSFLVNDTILSSDNQINI